MSKRNLIVVVAVVAVGLATNLVGVSNSEGFWPSGYSHNPKGIPIDWEVAGTIVSVDVTSPSPTGYFGPASLIDAFLRGKPEKAQFRVLAAAVDAPEEIEDCDGLGQYFEFDDMVVVFEDLSMLFAKMDPALRGWQCFTGKPAVANMMIIGGTGRYEGAKGHYQGNFWGIIFEDSQALIAEYGTIKGLIEW